MMMIEKSNYWCRLPESSVLESIRKTHQLLFSLSESPSLKSPYLNFCCLALVDPKAVWIDAWFASSFGRRLSSLAISPLLPNLLFDFFNSIDSLGLEEDQKQATGEQSKELKVFTCSHYIIFVGRLAATSAGSKLFPISLTSSTTFKTQWLLAGRRYVIVYLIS
jgi:hypothetical protein